MLVLDQQAHLLKTFNCANCKCQEGLDVIACFTKLKKKKKAVGNKIIPVVERITKIKFQKCFKNSC